MINELFGFFLSLVGFVALWLIIISIIQLFLKKFNKQNFLLTLGWLLIIQGLGLTVHYGQEDNILLTLLGVLVMIGGFWLTRKDKDISHNRKDSELSKPKNNDRL